MIDLTGAGLAEAGSQLCCQPGQAVLLIPSVLRNGEFPLIRKSWTWHPAVEIGLGGSSVLAQGHPQCWNTCRACKATWGLCVKQRSPLSPGPSAQLIAVRIPCCYGDSPA